MEQHVLRNWKDQFQSSTYTVGRYDGRSCPETPTWQEPSNALFRQCLFTTRDSFTSAREFFSVTKWQAPCNIDSRHMHLQLPGSEQSSSPKFLSTCRIWDSQSRVQLKGTRLRSSIKLKRLLERNSKVSFLANEKRCFERWFYFLHQVKYETYSLGSITYSYSLSSKINSI
jgi:hypothetical protein